MRGRKPRPLHEREKLGNPGKRAMPQPVPIGGPADIADLAQPPPDLSEEAKVCWRRDVAKLANAGVVDRVDIGSLESLCIAYARAKQAGRVLDTDGLFTEGAGGQVRAHPAWRMEREAWLHFDRLAEQYGLSPIGRVRLGMAELGRRTMQAELDDKIGKPVMAVENLANGDG